MNETNSLIIAPLPANLSLELTLNQSAIELREMALQTAAMVNKVENAAENKTAVEAQKSLKEFSRMVEKERVRLNEPALEYSRALMRLKEKSILEVEQEYGRISCLAADFQLLERRRVAEEQRKQQEELDRIEREKRAELRRIADEQARVEREAREAREAAERLASEAKNKKQREAAAAAQVEADRLKAEVDTKAAAAQAQTARVEERAAEASYIESRPVASTRASGQRVTEDWEVMIANPIEFARCNPDCVNWEKLPVIMAQIKIHLNNGRTLKGISALKVVNSGVRAAARRAVEV
jgi:hypothetical protein